MLIWDVTLTKTLRHAHTAFQLDLRLASAAPRLVLFGPSGAGKTQALKMIAGIVRPDGGHITIAGTRLFDRAAHIDLPPRERRLASMAQDYALFPHLTVRQNIAFARHRGWFNPPHAALDETAERWLRTLGLEGVAGLYPHQLSGGQRQRTALARALVLEPRALLLDEPFAALDKPLRRRLRDELRELQATLALPMLVITHDDEDTAALADEVVLMQAGRVVPALLDEAVT